MNLPEKSLAYNIEIQGNYKGGNNNKGKGGNYKKTKTTAERIKKTKTKIMH